MPTGNQITLVLTDLAGNYEVSQCTVNFTGTVVTITRNTVLASSAANLAFASFVGTVKLTNFIPSTLQVVLFNIQYQVQAQAALTQMASDIDDIMSMLQAILA